MTQKDRQEAAAFIARQMPRFGAHAAQEELLAFALRALEADEAYARESGAQDDPDLYDEDDACEAILAALEAEDENEPGDEATQTRLMLLDAFMEARALWGERDED